MKVTLAAAWHPRGELERYLKLAPILQEVYQHMVISVPPSAGPELERAVRSTGAELIRTAAWASGRHAALQAAQASGAVSIHYNDFDRLLRWVETRPDEWRSTVPALTRADCMILGRTPEAYASHPQALIQTEAISNRVISHFLGMEVDASAGGRGFSQAAAAFILANCIATRALGADAEWPILLHRAGFAIEYRTVDGLDWEIPDQYQSQAANPDRQKALAQTYDADPENWSRRSAVALEIVQAGLDAARRQLVYPAEEY